MNRMLPLAPAALALAGCSRDDDPMLACITPPVGVTESIAEGASGATITATDVAAVESPEMTGIDLVAVRFTVEGSDNQHEGVWVVSESGLIFAVDGGAQAFTHYPYEVDGHTFSVREPGRSEALACLP
ncbi:MAG: hypothetical protein ACTHXA_02320 [Gulosibacter sp.]|uniref:hypothetical protein n=1 Tax=Gulosibacter sp. TaxID=2817531 RepID=UPI003F8DD442